jgi:hypothetical protein
MKSYSRYPLTADARILVAAITMIFGLILLALVLVATVAHATDMGTPDAKATPDWNASGVMVLIVSDDKDWEFNCFPWVSNTKNWHVEMFGGQKLYCMKFHTYAWMCKQQTPTPEGWRTLFPGCPR